MDREIWRTVLCAIRRAARRLPKPKRKPKFPDWLIVAMYLWSVWHDRSLKWAADRSHYNSLFRPRKLPSVSRFGRRIRTARCQRILQQVHEDLSAIALASPLSYIDGKPLTVGACSKDKQAKRGRISGGFAKGYKLHVWATEDGRIPLWSVTSLNVGEDPVAKQLARRLPPLQPDSLVLADTNYDDRDLHKIIDVKGSRLLSPLKGAAEHPVTLRQMGQARREAIVAWEHHPHLIRYVLRQRDQVERIFSNLVCFGGGLMCLPPFVRGLERVTRWVGGKLILYHARLQIRKKRAAA